MASSIEIDCLLERYLLLLDRYMSLRGEMASLLSSLHQDIGRANFNAERGVRYGSDFYDDRMSASRRLAIRLDSDGAAAFSAKPTRPASMGTSADDNLEGESGPKAVKDPLRWFGLMAPSSLRSAQKKAVSMVSTTLPSLASLDAEMREVEIEIRRARKRKDKAAKKTEQEKATRGASDDMTGNVKDIPV